jgi:hypothetical protein
MKAAQGTNLNPNLLQRLKDNILAPSGLFYLDLSNSHVGPKELSVLGEIIKVNGLNCEGSAPILTMDFSGNCICGVNTWGKGTYDYDGLSDFVNCMIAAKYVSRQKRLDISKNFLSTKGMNLIAKLINDGPASLSELIVKNCNLNAECIHRFANVLGNAKNLLELHLSENGLGPVGGQLLADALTSNSRLRQLYVNSCDLGTVGSIAIFQALTNNNNLENLSINDNGFGDEGAEILGKMLRTNGKLRFLEIEENSIGFEGICSIAGGLQRNRSVYYIGLQWNDINNDGAAKIGEALRYNNTLGAIHILGNHIDVEGIKSIVLGSLEGNVNPIELDLGFAYRPPKARDRKADRKVIKELPTEVPVVLEGGGGSSVISAGKEKEKDKKEREKEKAK